jgi:hypothetical protein
MKVQMYSIYDKAAQAYVTPFFMHNKALAMRAFEDNINSKEENNINKHPEQFSLFCLGELDDSTGLITPKEQPELVCSALELVQPSEEQSLITEIKSLKALLATQEAK